MKLSNLGYSAEQVASLQNTNAGSTSHTSIEGFAIKVKSPIQVKLIRSINSKEHFKAKRQRREMRNQK